jgi:hypothetical protein
MWGSSCSECDMDQFGFISIYSPSLNLFGTVASLVYSVCEAMAASLSVASTAVSSARVAMVESGVVWQVCSV